MPTSQPSGRAKRSPKNEESAPGAENVQGGTQPANQPKPARPARASWQPITKAAEAQADLDHISAGTAARNGWTVDADTESVLINLSGETRACGMPVVRLPWSALTAAWAPAVLVDADDKDSIPLFYAGNGTLPNIGTLYWVATERDVLALTAAGLSACCLPTAGGWDVTEAHAEELQARSKLKVVVLADSSENGQRQGVSRAAALVQHGVPATLRTFPGGTVTDYTAMDEVVLLSHDTAKLQEALETLPAATLPLVPPGGFYWPKDVKFIWPDGYVLGRGGVYREKPTKDGPTLAMICNHPLWIGGRFGNDDGSDAAVQLVADLPDNRRLRRTVTMDTALTAARLPALTVEGFTGITSESASEVVRYISQALAANGAHLPLTLTARVMGSTHDHAGTPLAFVHGGLRYTPGKGPVAVDLSPASFGSKQRWGQYRTRGDAEKWAEALRIVRAGKLVIPFAALACASASLLNKPLRRMPHIFQLAGDGGRGKTETLKLVASLQQHPVGYGSMRATDNGMENNLAFANDLPVTIDEVQSYGAGKRDQEQALEALVYMISEGTGKDRMGRTGVMRDTLTWSCNVVMTGEKDLGDLKASGNTGAKRRVASFFGTPWGEDSPEMAKTLDRLNAITEEHHGHAIPMLATRLLEFTEADWARMRRLHRKLMHRWLKRETPACVNTGLAKTFAEAFAAWEIAGRMLADMFPAAFADKGDERRDASVVARRVAREVHGLLRGPYATTMDRMRQAPRAERTIDVVRGFVATNYPAFEGHGQSSMDAKRVGRVGEDQDKVGYVAIVPEALAEYMARHNLTTDTDKKHWIEEGWLLLTPDGKNRKARVNGCLVRCLTFRADVLMLEDDPEPAKVPVPAPAPLAAPALMPGNVPTPIDDLGELPF